MGRGLSQLQKHILTLAYRNAQAQERRAGAGADCYYYQIKAQVYGLAAGGYSGPGSHHFDKAGMGEDRYNAASAAISRAAARLQARGLVVCVCGRCSHWAGVNLTAEGWRVAAGLVDARPGLCYTKAQSPLEV